MVAPQFPEQWLTPYRNCGSAAPVYAALKIEESVESFL
jgi:hypothetical protein